jgi:hypothetical protein
MVFVGQAPRVAGGLSYQCKWESVPINCPGFTIFALLMVTEGGGSINRQLNEEYRKYWHTIAHPKQDAAGLSFNIQVIVYCTVDFRTLVTSHD